MGWDGMGWDGKGWDVIGCTFPVLYWPNRSTSGGAVKSAFVSSGVLNFANSNCHSHHHTVAASDDWMGELRSDTYRSERLVPQAPS